MEHRIIDGECDCRGTNLFIGYFGQPELTASAVTENGHLPSGALMVETSDGYPTWAGRNKDIIRRAGLPIDPSEIENLLSAHPKIAESSSWASRMPGWVSGLRWSRLARDPRRSRSWTSPACTCSAAGCPRPTCPNASS